MTHSPESHEPTRTPLEVLSLGDPNLVNIVQWSADSALLMLSRAGYEIVKKEVEPSEPPVPTEKLVDLGTTALYPFVELWNLPLNPEDLGLMAFAVLKHGQLPNEGTTPDYEAIISDVRQMISEHRPN